MACQAWVWTGDGDPVIEPAADPGAGWQKIGELDSGAASDVFRAVQHRLGYYSGSPPKSVRGYLSGDPRQEWVQRLDGAADEIHLAFGQLGSTGGYLTTHRPARGAIPKPLTPEAHPGSTTPRLFIGIEIRAGDDGHFDRH